MGSMSIIILLFNSNILYILVYLYNLVNVGGTSWNSTSDSLFTFNCNNVVGNTNVNNGSLAK